MAPFNIFLAFGFLVEESGSYCLMIVALMVDFRRAEGAILGPEEAASSSSSSRS